MGLADFLIIAALVFINGFFVAAEFALVKVRTSQIDQLVEEGNWAAKLTSRALDHLDAYLSASQVGITVASLALGWAIENRMVHGIKQTLEARAYAVARQYAPLLVNSVVGFIGPEYLYDGREIIRAGLEDHCCGKLLGLPMGCDVCYTNHADADQDDMDTLLTLLGVAGVNYIMGVPGADDVMLNYQSTSFHDSHYLRQAMKLRPAPEFEAWLERMSVMNDQNRLLPITPRHPLLTDYEAQP